MRRPSVRLQLDPKEPAGRKPKTVVGGLAVDEVPRVRRYRVGGSRPIAPALLSHHEEQAGSLFPGGAQSLDGHQLSRDDPLRIARASPVDRAPLLAARKERRHAVEVCREDHVWITERREEVESPAIDRLLGHAVLMGPQPVGKPLGDLDFASGCRVDVDERPGERDDV